MPPSALVIDDDVDIQLLGKMLLSRHGFDVATAGCLGELARQPGLLNTYLIVLDFGLGDFTGLDILDYLYDLKILAPILLLSSCSDETAAHAIAEGKAKGLKMLGFLPKAKLMTGLRLYRTDRGVAETTLDGGISPGHQAAAYLPCAAA